MLSKPFTTLVELHMHDAKLSCRAAITLCNELCKWSLIMCITDFHKASYKPKFHANSSITVMEIQGNLK